MKKAFLLVSILMFALQAPLCLAQQIDIELLAKGSIGWAHYDDWTKGVLDTRMGVYADVNVANPVCIESGLELKFTGFGQRFDYSGLSGSSSDFYEHYRYHIDYVAIPIIVKYQDNNNPTSFFNGFFAGLGFNVPFASSYKWTRYKTGLKSKSVDASGDGEIKMEKFTSPAISFRLGLDQKISENWGYLIEIENIKNVFKTGENRRTIRTFRIGVICYL